MMTNKRSFDFSKMYVQDIPDAVLVYHWQIYIRLKLREVVSGVLWFYLKTFKRNVVLLSFSAAFPSPTFLPFHSRFPQAPSWLLLLLMNYTWNPLTASCLYFKWATSSYGIYKRESLYPNQPLSLAYSFKKHGRNKIGVVTAASVVTVWLLLSYLVLSAW